MRAGKHVLFGAIWAAKIEWQGFVHVGLRTPRPATEPRDDPTRNFHEKYRKNPPRPEILEPQENTPKIPKKYQKCAFWYSGGIFSVFSGYFGRTFWESRISGRNIFFRYFSWKFRVGSSRGSVAGRGVLKCRDEIDPHMLWL